MKTQAAPPSRPSRQNGQPTASRVSAPQNQPGLSDTRPNAVVQAKLIDLMNGSAQVLQHQTLGEHINNSPRMVAQRMEHGAISDTQTQVATQAAPPPNHTGLPDNLKAGIESLSGISMDHVRVHFNSSQPAQLNAHAYAQGSEIHVAPGQERHLPHEAWHVVQQAQGRVQPAMQMKAGVAVNDDKGLETEADVMGQRALTMGRAVGDKTYSDASPGLGHGLSFGGVAQCFQRQNVKAGNGALIQLKTTIENIATEIEWEGAKGKVGKKMIAKLDPTDAVVGSATDEGLMTALDKKVAAYNKGMWARGHLLNHDLGGFGIPENLFPISAGANAHHAQAVEYPVKRALAEVKSNRDLNRPGDGVNVFYQVDVKGNPSHSQFHCNWYYANNGFNIIGQQHPAVIESKLNDSTKSDIEDPYFSALGRPNSLPDWHHGDRKGKEDLSAFEDEEAIEVTDDAQAIDAIDPLVVPTARVLSPEQLLEIQKGRLTNKIDLWFEREMKQIPERAREEAEFEIARKQAGSNGRVTRGTRRRNLKDTSVSFEIVSLAREKEGDMVRKLKRERTIRLTRGV